jgi:rod shape-determining protein MreB
LADPLNNIVSAVKSASSKLRELVRILPGMVLTGGGALLRDLDRLLMEEADCR